MGTASAPPIKEVWAVRFGKKAPDFEARKVVDLADSFHRVQGSTVLVAVHAEGANVIKNRAGKKISPQIYCELA